MRVDEDLLPKEAKRIRLTGSLLAQCHHRKSDSLRASVDLEFMKTPVDSRTVDLVDLVVGEARKNAKHLVKKRLAVLRRYPFFPFLGEFATPRNGHKGRPTPIRRACFGASTV